MSTAHFWTATIKPGQTFRQHLLEDLQVTQAAVVENPDADTRSILYILYGRARIALCSFGGAAGVLHARLKLLFSRNDKLRFQVVGPHTICLTGYHIADEEGSKGEELTLDDVLDGLDEVLGDVSTDEEEVENIRNAMGKRQRGESKSQEARGRETGHESNTTTSKSKKKRSKKA